MAGLENAGVRLARLGGIVGRAGQVRLTEIADWGVRRAMSPRTLTGVSLLAACCATAWFSSGNRSDWPWGALALCGWLAGRAGARKLSAILATRPARTRSLIAGPMTGSTDWLALPGAIWPDPGSVPAAPIAAKPAESWLVTVSAVAAEASMYGGIAAGGEAAGWSGTWQLAVAAVAAIAVRGTIGACRPPAPGRPGRRRLAAIAAPPPAARMVACGIGLLLTGPRLAFVTVIAIEAMSACLIIVGASRARTAQAPDHAVTVLICRDDGVAVRWVGRLAQGNLEPLPAVLAGLAASCVLAVLGMGNLPGFIVLAPLAVLLLAAPGSSHPHHGRTDWLVPAALQAGQFLYLATLGFGRSVPGPLVYSVCALNAIWFASLAAEAGAGTARVARAGWEGRLLLAGASAMLGLSSYGYVALAAYLGVLLGRRLVHGGHLPETERPGEPGEETAGDRDGSGGGSRTAAPAGH